MLAFMLCIFIHTQEVLAQIDPSLIVCHKYDNVNLGNDGSNYNNDLGTPFLMPFTTDHTGAANSAYVFTPTNFARIPHNANQVLGSCFTIAAWVKPSASFGLPFNGRIDIVSKWGSGMASYVMSLNTTGHIQAHTYNGSTVQVSTSASPISGGVWSHIAITFDGSKMRFYINGILNSTSNHTVIPTSCTYPIGIGHEGDNVTTTPSNAGTGFNGAIDEVRILKKTLSPSQVLYLMNEAACPTTVGIEERGFTLIAPIVVCENKPYTLNPNENYYLTLPHTIYWGDGSSSTSNIHTYTDTGLHHIVFITGGSCPDTADIWVLVEDCNVCKVEVEVERNSCLNFTLDFTSKFINVECHKWLVDGLVVSLDSLSRYTFTPGTHQVCLKVFGSNIHYPNRTCCGEKCITITTPVPIEQHVDTTVCSLSAQGTVSCINVNLLNYAPAGTVGYSHPLLPVATSGSQEFCLEEGYYIIHYYDANGCLLKTLFLSVALTQQQPTYCSKSIVDICTYTTDPNTVMPDCDSCGEGANTIVGPAILLSEDIPNKTRYYYREIKDLTNCRICYFGFSISVYSPCMAIAQFTPPALVPPSPPYRYTFNNMSTGQGVPCGGPEWRIHQKVGSLWMPLGSPLLGPQILDYTFPGPGEYRVCMTVKYCFCGQECSSTYCMTFIINANGTIQVTDEGQEFVKPPENEEGKEDNISPTEKLLLTTTMSNANVKVKPNPSNGLYKIIYTSPIAEAGSYSLELLDMAGRVVLSKDDLQVNNEEMLDLTGFSDGFYVVKVTMGKEVETLRILKY